MGEANELRSRTGMEGLSLNLEKYPRDLLQRFTASSSGGTAAASEDDSEEIELNLGLSLGGRFGVDKSSNKLIRSSSIAGSIPMVHDVAAVAPVAYPSLMRTSSLPVETEEQWRKRKELQSLRRMEAKRRRSEKQRNSKAERDGSAGADEERREIEGAMGLNLRDKQHFATANRFNSIVAPPFGLPSWAAAARQTFGTSAGGGGVVQPSSQGSVESKGGCSSGTSELESKTAQADTGPSSHGEARSPGGSSQSLQEQSSIQDASGTKVLNRTSSTSRAEMENPSKKPDKKGREIGKNAMEDMPCVFTKGDSPNGRRVDGILYKYGKGEEVRIMCVCHGSFLSPADFVKHAGGGDVTHPLRHIVINPSAASSSSL